MSMLNRHAPAQQAGAVFYLTVPHQRQGGHGLPLVSHIHGGVWTVDSEQPRLRARFSTRRQTRAGVRVRQEKGS
jgi:hypothetical protein